MTDGRHQGAGHRFSDPAELVDALQIDFSAEQLAAICAPLEPGVIIAGAGSGKTTVMAARVVWLVGTGQVRPDQILGLTFTRKAAAELASRIREALARSGVFPSDSDDGREVVTTYDSFAGWLVAEHGLRMGLETSSAVITGAARYRLASRVVNSATGPFPSLSRLRPLSVVERVLSLDADLQSHLVTGQQIRAHAETFLAQLSAAPSNNRGNVYAAIRNATTVVAERLELMDLVDAYAKLKTELGVCEFADTLAAAAKLVRTVESVPRLLRQQFAVVLLDEYQDTSSAQAQLLIGLFGDGHPVTAVGDPFQAIYGWRGAAASNITSFATDFPSTSGAPARQYQLSVNRRSEQQILDIANDIGASLGSVQVSTAESTGVLRAPDDRRYGVVLARGFESSSDEVNWVAESIADQGRDPDVMWSDTAILVRRNADIAPLFEALSERDVPVEIVGLGGLLLLPEVAVVLSTLMLLHDPASNADLLALLSGQRWLIGPTDLQALGERAREIARSARQDLEEEGLEGDLAKVLRAQDPTESCCLYDAVLDPGDVELSPEARIRIGQFSRELETLRRYVDEPVADLVRRVARTTGVGFEVSARGKGNRSAAANQVASFIDAVSDYVDVDGDASLAGLLAYLGAEIEYGTGLDQAVPGEQNSVKILTIHRAKGLEWQQVYLPGLADKVFPSDRGADNYIRQAGHIPAPLRGDASGIPQLTEVTNRGLESYAAELRAEQSLAEDRLAYVAVTRAKKKLIGSWHVWASGLQRPRSPSAYFLAIEKEAAKAGNVLAEAPEPGPENPLGSTPVAETWPVPIDPALRAERIRAAEWVRNDMAMIAAGGSPVDDPMSAEATALVARWDRDIAQLLAQAREANRTIIEIEIPESLSVTALARLQADPDQWAAAQLRPMPRPPSPAAELGSRFHAWVQRRSGLMPLLCDDSDPVEDDLLLHRLQSAFESGPYADRTPVAVEAPFVLRLGPHLIRGRIDAVYRAEGQHDFQIVDWKTSVAAPDPLQLALYRLAWARAMGIAAERVDAVFYHVLTREILRPETLVDEAELIAGLNRD